MDKEVAYSDLLATYLREHLPADAQIEREYRHLDQTLDIYVRCSGILLGDEVFIEVRHRLNEKSEFDRLVEHITALQPNKNQVIVVLVGQCDVELAGLLRSQFTRQLSGSEATIIGAPLMQVIKVLESNEKQ